jgi:hypothetical protein
MTRGRARRPGTARIVGFCVAVTALSGVVAVASAGTGVGDPFHLGRSNRVDKPTKLSGATKGSNLVIDNNGSGTALSLRVGDGVPADKTKPPLKVDSQKKVKHLNADLIDGRGPGPRAYGFINFSTDNAEDSSGIVDVTWDNDPEGDRRYCFDLTFNPHVGVGSAFFNNAAIVAVDTQGSSTLACPEGYRDAAVRVYDTAGNSRDDVGFHIMFE